MDFGSLDELMSNPVAMEVISSTISGVLISAWRVSQDLVDNQPSESTKIKPSNDTLEYHPIGLPAALFAPMFNRLDGSGYYSMMPLVRAAIVYEAAFWASYYSFRKLAKIISRFSK